MDSVDVMDLNEQLVTRDKRIYHLLSSDSPVLFIEMTPKVHFVMVLHAFSMDKTASSEKLTPSDDVVGHCVNLQHGGTMF